MSLADAGEMSDEELRQYHRSLLEWQRIARTERLKALDEMDRRYGSDTNDTE